MDPLKKEKEENKDYLQKLKDIIFRTNGTNASRGPAQLMEYLYLGNKHDAQNKSLLKRLRITHVLNCAATPEDSGEAGFQESSINYDYFTACDNENYPILMHYRKAKRCIDAAKSSNGRILVHCEMGINRSGAICIAYVMTSENITLLEAVRRVKFDRPVVLCNEGFQRQLIEFAREEDLLHRRK